MATSAKLNRSSAPKKPSPSTFSKSRPSKFAKPNASILSFFQKTSKPEDSLFVGGPNTEDAPLSAAGPPPAEENGVNGHPDGAESIFEGLQTPCKKRRFSEDDLTASKTEAVRVRLTSQSAIEDETKSEPPKSRPNKKTPFIMDSDSEDEAQDGENNHITRDLHGPEIKVNEDTPATAIAQAPCSATSTDEDAGIKYEPPPLKKENSSTTQVEAVEEFADLEDFDIDEFEGEEMREMRFMREQARLEATEAAALSGEDFVDDFLDDQSPTNNCPICNGSLVALTISDATRHVNGCLDGDPLPLPPGPGPAPAPMDVAKEGIEAPATVEAAEISKRFARAAVPRPGQPNPFTIETKSIGATSAFSKLMSGNAEDSAWASAAAAESASRGRPAYQRTCPFYKIIPGFSICVDAFRYGAVEGCEAYFLSHFHSDHYIGLTANWRHGPIYCSRVTGGLVKQQLRTAAKWVVELEFEKSYDIPGTSASVTMIPANHCPGSSLFLFEKSFGGGGSRRTKRILHCGDFRACPDHVRHPLLRPDVVDTVAGGKLRPQKIDLCYLDTTYLNPRYSFPPQGDVIRACADLCRSLSPDPNAKDDISNQLKAERRGQTDSMNQFVHGVESPERRRQATDSNAQLTSARTKKRLLVVCGTYSIGKERICVAIAKGLQSKIFASPTKIKICQRLNDPELSALLTSDPTEAQVHMQMLMEIRAETLQDYLDSYKPHFSRIVGFRPSGWNFRHASGKAVSPNTPPGTLDMKKMLHGPGWRTRFGRDDFVWQRGSTKEAMCFGVPYSEHSSFRELAMFVMSLRIEKVVPTVNVGSEQSRKRMKGWIDKWMMERRRGGLLRPLVEGTDEADSEVLWGSGTAGMGGGAWW